MMDDRQFRQGLGLQDRSFSLAGDRQRVLGKLRRILELTASRQDRRPHDSPNHLSVDIVLGGQRLGGSRQSKRLVVPSAIAHNFSE